MSAGEQVQQVNIATALHMIGEANRAGDTAGVSSGIDAAMAALNRFEAEHSAIVRLATEQTEKTTRLVEAIKPQMGTLNYYGGPGARTAVGQDSIDDYRRLQLALARAQGKPCPLCDDSGRDRQWRDSPGWESTPCPLRHVAGHDVDLPPDVIAFMVKRRDEDRAEDARPKHDEPARRCGPPRFEAELDAMGVA